MTFSFKSYSPEYAFALGKSPMALTFDNRWQGSDLITLFVYRLNRENQAPLYNIDRHQLNRSVRFCRTSWGI